MHNNLSPTFITNFLQDACTEEGVQCLYALESGSRAWGFASPDSDYDVRFIYLRPAEDYLRITRLRDVIEHTDETHNLDIVGWDAPKALQLIGKSNPSAIEWLHTPTVYLQNDAACRILLATAKQCFSAKALAMHYTSLARDHSNRYITGKQTIAPKKYFYALRSVLSARYVIDNHAPAPIVFADLLAASSLPRDIQDIIQSLLAIKQQGAEKQQITPVQALNEYLLQQTAELERLAPATPGQHQAHIPELIESAFRELLRLNPAPRIHDAS